MTTGPIWSSAKYGLHGAIIQECCMHLSLLTVVIAGLVGQPGPAAPPAFVPQYAKVLTFYYKAPDPALGPKLLREMIKPENLEHPWFAKNEHVRNLLAGQLGDIAAGNPKIVRDYEAAFAAAPTAGRRLIVRCLADCGDKEAVRRIDAGL